MFAPQQAVPEAQPGAATTPFTPHEHALFVEGVEVFCNNNNGTAVGEGAWRHIAAHVRTRSPEEVKAHAQYYLMSLQSRNPEITRAAAFVSDPSPPPPPASAARCARASARALPFRARPGEEEGESLAGSRRLRANGRRPGHRRRMRPLRTPSRPTRRATRTDGPKSPRSSRPSPRPTCSSGTSASSATSSRSSAVRGSSLRRQRRRPPRRRASRAAVSRPPPRREVGSIKAPGPKPEGAIIFPRRTASATEVHGSATS